MDDVFDRFSKIVNKTGNKFLKAALDDLSKKLAKLPHSKAGLSALLSCSLVKLTYTDNNKDTTAVCTSVPNIVKRFSSVKRSGEKKTIAKTNKSFGVVTYDVVSGRKIYIDISKNWTVILFIPLYDENAELIKENAEILEKCMSAYSKLLGKKKSEDVFI